MGKTGRNEPCPCGSGAKYKRCCLKKDEAAERATREAAQAVIRAEDTALLDALTEQTDRTDALITSSNAVLELIQAGLLDEAEAGARDLLVRFPEVHDGYNRLGQVYEARGEHKQAADFYRQVIQFMRAHPDDYPETRTRGLSTAHREARPGRS
jgi:tetratricopeptide (TPR) repeat protein